MESDRPLILGSVAFDHDCGVRVTIEVLQPMTLGTIRCPVCGRVALTTDPDDLVSPFGTPIVTN